MTSLSIFPFSLIFILALLIPLGYTDATKTLSNDIINKTCQACSLIKSSNFSYGFCSATLAAIPVSHVTNLPGLGLISLELALVDATNTMLKIDGMLTTNESSLICKTCLDSCLELYSDMSAKLEECVGEYLSGGNEDVYSWISEMMQGTALCEGEFEGIGLKSPLTRENYSLSQLYGMVLCIIDLISPIIKSRPSISA
ncbi:putative invertase inhibitor [Silene latifolia]|uniref:putative invertase inhibitor n=1 Tax=Silene latifolia TaxID=37657 RepID=UPI003D78746F